MMIASWEGHLGIVETLLNADADPDLQEGVSHFSSYTFKEVRNTSIPILTEFELHTVSYGPSLSPLIYGPSAKRAGYTCKSMEKTRIRNIQYGPRKRG